MGSSTNDHKTKKSETSLQTVEIKVMMDCDGCKLKIKKALSSLKGIMSVEINRKQQKVTVTGYIDAKKVLKKVESTGKKAEISSRVPKRLVVQPERVEATGTNTLMNTYLDMFSDENPNSCSIL